jgi:hypothetical protein
LCDWKKTEIVEELETYRELVKEPEFVCKDCGRAEEVVVQAGGVVQTLKRRFLLAVGSSKCDV